MDSLMASCCEAGAYPLAAAVAHADAPIPLPCPLCFLHQAAAILLGMFLQPFRHRHQALIYRS